MVARFSESGQYVTILDMKHFQLTPPTVPTGFYRNMEVMYYYFRILIHAVALQRQLARPSQRLVWQSGTLRGENDDLLQEVGLREIPLSDPCFLTIGLCNRSQIAVVRFTR